ncbi:16S rRNA (uracil1498-N3)-methyltransferase [Natronospira proteinivora]|uniref:Ribosomal RNA small subunit methyltransferase E n=1 Tax=Natronospira proteinivora TaxID=1807133 RepID=A0ABT1GAR9_9GAMM|nr:16S rRNA (uracil(1498)-N(3))-methyltransferase [Natronospira proteinivora]MCP1728413.1 16S rRNA (uracil1498-N3)-methyltransferase [Natronospira proteinivora]
MRIPRVLARGSFEDGEIVPLDGSTVHYLRRVLRLKDEHPLRIFNGVGEEYEATLGPGEQARILQAIDHQAESPLPVTLIQGISRGQKMDYALQKAVELGVTAIRPAFCERSVVRLDDKRLKKRLDHWQGVIESACAQSGRSYVPELQPPFSLIHIEKPATGEGLFLAPSAEQSLATVARPQALSLVIGPEGGLSDAEIRVLKAAAYRGTRLGPRVLRTETASVAALAAIQTLWGDLG